MYNSIMNVAATSRISADRTREGDLDNWWNIEAYRCLASRNHLNCKIKTTSLVTYRKLFMLSFQILLGKLCGLHTACPQNGHRWWTCCSQWQQLCEKPLGLGRPAHPTHYQCTQVCTTAYSLQHKLNSEVCKDKLFLPSKFQCICSIHKNRKHVNAIYVAQSNNP